MRTAKRARTKARRASRATPAASRRRPPARANGLPERRAPVATLLLHPALLRTIAAACAGAGKLETGGPLIGTVQRSWADEPGGAIVSLLATVPPGPALRATCASVALGRSADGERAASAIRWWRQVTGLDLVHLGDWHKHHSGIPEPSEGDHDTAVEMQAESSSPIWLSAIAIGKRNDTEKTGAQDNLASIAGTHAAAHHVRFYRAAGRAGLVPITVRVEAHALPTLPALPWHIVDPARFAAECRLLQAAGFSLAITGEDSRRRPGLTLRIGRDGKPPLTVVTGPAYPYEPPVLRNDGRRIKTKGVWTPGRFLVDLLKEPK